MADSTGENSSKTDIAPHRKIGYWQFKSGSLFITSADRLALALKKAFEAIAEVVKSDCNPFHLKYSLDGLVRERKLSLQLEKRIDPLREVTHDILDALHISLCSVAVGKFKRMSNGKKKDTPKRQLPNEVNGVTRVYPSVRQNKLFVQYIEKLKDWKAKCQRYRKGDTPFYSLLEQTFDEMMYVGVQNVDYDNIDCGIESIEGKHTLALTYDEKSAEPLRALVYGLIESLIPALKSVYEEKKKREEEGKSGNASKTLKKCANNKCETNPWIPVKTGPGSPCECGAMSGRPAKKSDVLSSTVEKTTKKSK